MTHQRRHLTVTRGLVAAMLLLVPATSALAKPATMKFKEVTIMYGKDNAGQADAKRVEVPLSNVNRNLINATAAGFTVEKAGTAAGGDFRLVVTKKGQGTVSDGEKITVKITGLDSAKVTVGTPVWFGPDVTTLIGTTEKTQVTSSDVKGDPIYSVLNEMSPSVDIVLSELRFYFNHGEVDPDAVDPLTWIPGASAIVTGPIDLFGFDSTADYTVPSIDDGKAFLVQGRLVDETGFVIGAFVDEYVPTPAGPSLALVGVGFAALMVSQRRRGG